MFPVAGVFVPNEALAYPRILDGRLGIAIWCAWAAGFAAMTFAMHRLRGTPLRVLLAAQLAAGVGFVLVHAMPSIDTYAYLGYGNLLLHGGNPWKPGSLVAFDEVGRSFITAWSQNPPACRYGPAFVFLEAGIIKAIGPMAMPALVLTQRILSLAAAACITLVVRGPNVRYWALNPFVSYFYVTEAHNDVVFLLLVCIAARIRQPIVAGLLVGLGASVKIVAFAALAFEKRKSLWLKASGAAVGVAAMFALFPEALDTGGLTAQIGAAINSPFSLLQGALLTDRVARPIANEISIGLVTAALILSALSVRWTRRDRLTLVTLLVVFALPAFWPWYLGWALVASLTSSTRVVMRSVLALCAASFVLELPQIWILASAPQITLVFLGASAIALQRCGFFAPRRVAN